MKRLVFCKKYFVLTIALAASLWAFGGQAQTGQKIDKGRAAEIAQAQFGGELFGKIKETTASDGTKVFEVRLDTKGHVDIIVVDSNGRARQKN